MTSENEKIGFSDFGTSFQNSLVKSIVMDKEFAGRIQEVINLDYFDLIHHRMFIKKVFEYRDKYNKHPSIEILKTIIKTEFKDTTEILQNQIKDFFKETFSKGSKIEDVSYVKDKSIDFCKKQKLYNAMERSIDLLKTSSFDEISGIIGEALKLGEENRFGHDYVKDFEDRYQIHFRNPVTTGWGLIDGLTQGGLGKGELGVAISPTGVGKSHCLVHLGASALKDGKSVIHYTMELSDTHVGNRYDACLVEIGLKDLHACKEQVYGMVQDLSGSLLIKEYPTKTASTRTLRNHLDKIKQQGRKIDLIIVDYGDLLRPLTTYKEKRDNLGSIYEDLRAIAQDYECPLFTASQTNRSGLNAEIITMESISEAFQKCFVADFIFSLSRTIDEKNNNTGKIFIAKNRNGPDGIVFPIFMDASRVKIDVMKQSDGILMNGGDILKSTEEKLKERYREMLNNKKGN